MALGRPSATPSTAGEAPSPKFRYLYEVDGAAEGYAIYRVKTDWDDRGPKGQLLVVEAMASTPRAERAVWSFLFGVDLMRTTKAGRVQVPHPLLLELADPRALGSRGERPLPPATNRKRRMSGRSSVIGAIPRPRLSAASSGASSAGSRARTTQIDPIAPISFPAGVGA